MRYFSNVDSLEELRKQYKELLKKFHPDNPNGSTEATQEINSEYDELFKSLKNRHTNRSANTEKADFNNMKYDFSEDQKLRDVLQQIINFDGVEIEIVGCWIWCGGNTYPYKNELKALGFKWGNAKKKWYFHTEAFRKKSNKKLSMDDIRNYYGSTEVKTEERKQIKQA